MTQSVVTRALEAKDEPLLGHATLGNLNWAGERFTERDVTSRAEFSHYTRVVLGRGDFGFVAERAGVVIGVAWALFLPKDDPGYGFVDESTPEISLWVRDDARRNGVGRLLMRRLKREAEARQICRLSLSVEADNHAKRLYVSEGFTPVAGREHAGVMLWVRDAPS